MAGLKGRAVFDAFKVHFTMLICPEDRTLLYAAIVYGLAVSLLTLAVPISVQMLVNTVANIASNRAVYILSTILFGLLIIYMILNLFQSYALELFERRFYASMTAQFTLRNIHGSQHYLRERNRVDLTNRYFDIMQVQKIMPEMVSGMFATFLQMLVGVVLVSFYHPWLFLFNVLLLFFIWVGWRIWGYRAMSTAQSLSEAKYRTARHLQDVAQYNDFYKAKTCYQFAVNRTDTLTGEYLKERRAHFRHVFSQQGMFLFVYAASSSALLGLGGELVIRDQLTIGQLVAAELILAAVLLSISRLDMYLKKFYDISAALEEISRLYNVPIEKEQGTHIISDGALPLHFAEMQSKSGKNTLKLDWYVQPGEKWLIEPSTAALQRSVCDVLERYVDATYGEVRLGEYDILDYEPAALRNNVLSLDRINITEATILEYLTIQAPNASRAQVNDMLEAVELGDAIDRLPDGVDTLLLCSGFPLRFSEISRLKLAATLLAKPNVLVLNEYFDAIAYHQRKRIFTYVCQQKDLTLLYFSNRHDDMDMFDRYMYMDWQHYQCFDSADALCHRQTIEAP